MSFLQQLLFGEDSPAPSLEYTIKRQRRKTLALHILKDASIEVRAPKWVSKRDIASFVEERTGWALREQSKALQKLAHQTAYRHGECHDYLGQKYPLDISPGSRASIKMHDGMFYIKARDPFNEEQIKKILEGWYKRQGQVVFTQRLALCYQQLPIDKLAFRSLPDLKIRKMQSRWGSCSSKGVITLNSLLMRFPLASIDYVIFHELCHLWEFNHGKAFYRLLTQFMPDWKQHKSLLDKQD